MNDSLVKCESSLPLTHTLNYCPAAEDELYFSFTIYFLNLDSLKSVLDHIIYFTFN